ncbi:uncharacterized protein LOC109531909 isoform X2 [Hippocampus comes]|uniref:uncharacterized protein LOC109531894 isoform X2 n=1 Tax=Hippocampus comes TaxID=109280 RepID=UPI00094E279F|nr:PREDICTED: uncharacterized protein LOC109531894 isoform X2 [Hippocampus comes]XP_019752014.1 PREDICTED: uncharacterized protein LOC109531909 isoform X2 [Hippocampus comes]
MPSSAVWEDLPKYRCISSCSFRTQLNMSAVCLGLATLLCLFCTTPAKTVENIEVIRRPPGGSVSIQCSHVPQGEMHMTFFKGLKKDFQILHMMSQKTTTAKEFSGRLRVEGIFPNVDVIISNLTSEDTGLYFCDYQWYDDARSEQKRVDDDSPVMLVVEDEQPCANPNQNILLVIVVVSAAVLFGVFIALLLWIIPKIKRWHAKYRPRRTVTNDVYEEMRGTLRA